MKFMLIMRITDAALATATGPPIEQIINAMGAYNESLMNAGVLLSGEGLASPEDGSVISFDDEEPEVTGGPYGETRELFNGFWIIQTASKDEAIAWASTCPLGPGNSLEVRRVTDESDFEDFADNEYIQKEKGWREELAQKSPE